MAALVIDASIASAWCFPDERTSYTEAVLKNVSSLSGAFAPALWAYEVRNSILIGMRRGRIDAFDAAAFLNSIQDLNIRLIEPQSYDAVFELAKGEGLTVYDAAYLELAVRLGVPLGTLDGALQKAAVRSGVERFEP